MTERAVEYSTHKTEVRSGKMKNVESILNEYASEGWRLVETFERDGTTIGLVFERSV